MKNAWVPAMALAMAVSATSALAASGTVLRSEKLYLQPSAASAVAGSAAKGANVNVLAKQGGWLKVSAGKSTGWIRLLSVRMGAGGLGGSGLGDVVGVATSKSNPSKVVAVAGLRGLNDEDLKQAKFDAAELARLDSTTVTATQARQFANQGKLAVSQVASLPEPKSQSSQNDSPWGDRP